MKKGFKLFLTLLLVFALALTGCSGSQDNAQQQPGQEEEQQQPAEEATSEDTSWEDIKARGYYIVGLDDSFPPMGFRDEKNEIVGFDIDMAKEAAKKMGIEVRFQPVVWTNAIMELNNKNVDVIWNGMTITEERIQKINFSKPYLANRLIIITQSDSAINSKADLAGKKVAVQAGSSAAEAVNADAETLATFGELVEFGTYTEALMDVNAGRMDAVIIDEVVGRYYIAKEPDLYKVLDDHFGAEEYGVGFRKSDAAFQAELQKALDAMNEDGTAKAISEKWFGADMVLK